MKLSILFALQIVLSYGYSQSMNLKPKVTNQGYLFDSTQVREIARLAIEESIKNNIIAVQDSSINNLENQIKQLDTVVVYKDSIISHKNSVIELQKSNLEDFKIIVKADKELLKRKHRRQKKKMFLIILVKAAALFTIIVSK